MTVPFQDPENPWIMTKGRNSHDCGLNPEQRIDRLRKVGLGRFAYDMDVPAAFDAKAGPAYVAAYRPHASDAPHAPTTQIEAEAMARETAIALSALDMSIRSRAA